MTLKFDENEIGKKRREKEVKIPETNVFCHSGLETFVLALFQNLQDDKDFRKTEKQIVRPCENFYKSKMTWGTFLKNFIA